MSKKLHIILATLVFLNPFFTALFISTAQPTMVHGTFILGVILGFLAAITALILSRPAFVKTTFFFAGVLTIIGWSVFLLFRDAPVPIPGFILVFSGGVLALGSAFWAGNGCPQKRPSHKHD